MIPIQSLLRPVLVALLTVLPSLISGQGHSRATITIDGTVIGYDAETGGDLFKPEGITTCVLLVRVDGVIVGTLREKYIWVEYQETPEQPADVPDGLIEGSRIWRFTLLPQAGKGMRLHDRVVRTIDYKSGKELAPPRQRIKRVPGAENAPFPAMDQFIKNYWLQAIKPVSHQ